MTFLDEPLLAKSGIVAQFNILSRISRLRREWPPKVPTDSWILACCAASCGKIQAERRKGNKVVLMGTYSPVDALIVARLVSDRERVPFGQDFRDGLVFESRGARRALRVVLKRIFESWALRSAIFVTTVSNSLVRYFRQTYPDTPVKLLYNGFDRPYQLMSHLEDVETVQHPVRALTVGHFGRISASDFGSFKTLRCLCDYVECSRIEAQFHFLGTLLAAEKELLLNSPLPATFHSHIARNEAIRQMAGMSALLLVTSNRTSVATGKLFEYLFSGRRIVLATLCHNEAARILEEIGDDDIILDFSNPSALPSVDELVAHLNRPFTRNRDRIRRFEKSNQAKELAVIIEEAALKADNP